MCASPTLLPKQQYDWFCVSCEYMFSFHNFEGTKYDVYWCDGSIVLVYISNKHFASAVLQYPETAVSKDKVYPLGTAWYVAISELIKRGVVQKPAEHSFIKYDLEKETCESS